MTTKLIHQSQQDFFATDTSKGVDFRIRQLKKLLAVLKAHESELFEAIYKDFKKSSFDTYATELGLVYHEISLFIKKLKKWSKPKHVRSGLANFPAKSYIIPEPLGNTLVIGAWNYPYLLSLKPAIAAIGAGNTVILKPSEIPANTSACLAKIINTNFEATIFRVIEGGVPETTELLQLKFDKIFFTGSTPVGKIIYKAAAENLTPVTLELGGKSPCIVLKDAPLKVTAKRLVWGKFMNAGQTCVAPDYVLVDQEIEADFLKALKTEIEALYSSKKVTENFTQIINDKNYQRLVQLIPSEKVYCGGTCNAQERFIAPTVLSGCSFEDAIMQDEIFGPILPVIAFNDLDSVITQVKARPKPLSCYVYSNHKKDIKKLLKSLSFGGGAVNDSVMHLSNSHLPFGGVGQSGIGSYHGKYGFDTFTHYKSILHKATWLELNLKYAPYSLKKLKIVKWLMG